ncbi:hypothetical protein FQR65_LT01699 [Abscondita terminalis]|nr:hypothetical protein FQR65_LT01699 [Abscondita terminalis]
MFRKKILFALGVLQLCLFKYCHNVQPIPQIDAIGYLTKMLTNFLNNVLHPVLPGVDDSFYCSVETLYAQINLFGDEKTGPKYIELVGTELKLSLRPRGTCRYCCVLKNPRNYMSIYFVTKPKNNTIKLKIIKKKGYLKSKGFNSNIDTIMYIHGFSEHGLGVSAKGVRDAYLSKEKDYNIMLLDWAHLSVFPWYTEAVENSKIVGNILGDFVRFYSNTGELFVDKLHLIGFSLGSHIAGSVGKLLKKEKLSRITALDPAFPQFSLTDTTQRLSTSDAKYVDVIHTDGGIFGFPTSLGHADFYPNGGQQVQPGCEPSQLAENGDLISIVNIAKPSFQEEDDEMMESLSLPVTERKLSKPAKRRALSEKQEQRSKDSNPSPAEIKKKPRRQMDKPFTTNESAQSKLDFAEATTSTMMAVALVIGYEIEPEVPTQLSLFNTTSQSGKPYFTRSRENIDRLNASKSLESSERYVRGLHTLKQESTSLYRPNSRA